jgi:hypothetical protein
MTSTGEGGFGLPSPRRHVTGAPPAPVTTTPWMENALANQAMMMAPAQTAALWSDTGLPFEQRHTHKGGSKRKPVLGSPLPSKSHHHNEVSTLASKPLP